MGILRARRGARRASSISIHRRRARAGRRCEARPLRHNGKADEGIALLEKAVKDHAGEPNAYVTLAQVYSEADRGAQAVKVLQDAQSRFPNENLITFELGAVLDKQKRFADAE